ncbi:MAG: ribonuclease H-like domain-containing protein [Roseburia sp.]
MITWHEEVPFDFSDPITDQTFTEDAIFFDIETTGFSPARTSLYLIGCATRRGDLLCLNQFFAETKAEEETVMRAFFAFLERYSTILSFHGIGFDIPYLKGKCAAYHIQDPFSAHVCLDLYKEISRLKFLLKLPNLKQKSLEIFLGIQREDLYSGGELIAVYEEYLRHPSDKAISLLRVHNYEDVLYMPKLLPILAYRELFRGEFTVRAIDANEYTSLDGLDGNKELLFTLSHTFPTPQKLSTGDDLFYLSVNTDTTRLRVKLLDGELKFFFANPNDYYYLPEEDIAVHKSIAVGVDKEHRKKATAASCYTKKHAIFLPQYSECMTPVYRQNRKDRISYFALTDSFISSPDAQHRYISHVLRGLSQRRVNK